MSTHNLCFEQKYEKCLNFLSEIFNFSVINFSVYLNRQVFVMPLHAYWLNCFSCAEGVWKATENTWKFVVFIDLYLIFGYFGCQCSIVENSPWEGSKMGGYALYLYK